MLRGSLNCLKSDIEVLRLAGEEATDTDLGKADGKRKQVLRRGARESKESSSHALRDLVPSVVTQAGLETIPVVLLHKKISDGPREVGGKESLLAVRFLHAHQPAFLLFFGIFILDDANDLASLEVQLVAVFRDVLVSGAHLITQPGT